MYQPTLPVLWLLFFLLDFDLEFKSINELKDILHLLLKMFNKKKSLIQWMINVQYYQKCI